MDEDTKRLFHAIEQGDEASVRRLLESEGADAASVDETTGRTVLMSAAEKGRMALVQLLLANGAPWNALDRQGLCAGDLAMAEGHQETVDCLVEEGVRAELVLGAVSRNLLAGRSGDEGADGEAPYLAQRVEYSEGRLMDEQQSAVMMAWEKPLMEAHATAVLQGGDSGGVHVLNIGFGMGLVDTAIQQRAAATGTVLASHTICEAHPAVHQRMLDEGWGTRAGVRIVFGRWQDQLPQLMDRQYDGIFFDTYGEYYEDMRHFHDQLPQLLRRPHGVYSFFNGLCGDNAFFHVVYCHLLAREVSNRAGLETQFVPLPIRGSAGSSEDDVARNQYWRLDTYFLPLCSWPQEEEAAKDEEK
eukprot:TRINITY_DN19226_c0_g1_i1.p1 TRINITY_DN19226_c0_g1~~TRINITY_DN19226_c0_g1_i1.p1  ORF type:complete len:358 (-),score=85.01 TRINITY_DN19226_c0_g1_i1:220-1293(-)